MTEVLTNYFGDVSTRPAVIVDAESIDDVVAILKAPRKYPAPVRAIGSNHSTTPCGTADGGTIIRMRMNQILRLGDDTVTVQAGATYIDVAKELARLGRQFYVNPEIGNLTVGSAACCGTKSASMPGEFGQVSSYVTHVKMVLPSGEILEVGEDDPQLLRAIRSSYGLFGVVVEVTLKTRALMPLAVYFETFSISEFGDQINEILGRGDSTMLYTFPFEDRITVEFRRYNPGVPGRPNRVIWPLRNFAWSNVAPFLARQGRRPIVPGPVQRIGTSIVDRGIRAGLDRVVRAEYTMPADQMIRFPHHGGQRGFTFSFFAFPQDEYSQIYPAYVSFLEAYFRETGYRPDMLTVGYHVAQDDLAQLSYSADGPVITIDPVTTGGPGWLPFVEAYNEFCTAHGGKPLLNQSPGLTGAQLRAAYGDQVDALEQVRRSYDPQNRLLSPYFAALLGVPTPAKPAAKRRTTKKATAAA